MRIALAALVLIFAAGPGAAATHDVVEGNPASSVKVLIYDDLQGPDCQRFRILLDEKILPRYGSKVAFVHRDFPVGRDDWARPAAIAARWVYEQNSQLGITIRRELLAEQDNITSQNLKQWLTEFASRNHLDQKGIIEALSDQRLGALVDQDRQGAVARGVISAPTAFIGGVSFAKIILYEDLARALDEALAR
ncbi:MAG TPA: thioredoxin domain-containing protein [Bryobacteraceae bacterium]|jgi:protein-disulfide isomerase